MNVLITKQNCHFELFWCCRQDETRSTSWINPTKAHEMDQTITLFRYWATIRNTKFQENKHTHTQKKIKIKVLVIHKVQTANHCSNLQWGGGVQLLLHRSYRLWRPKVPRADQSSALDPRSITLQRSIGSHCSHSDQPSTEKSTQIQLRQMNYQIHADIFITFKQAGTFCFDGLFLNQSKASYWRKQNHQVWIQIKNDPKDPSSPPAEKKSCSLMNW